MVTIDAFLDEIRALPETKKRYAGILASFERWCGHDLPPNDDLEANLYLLSLERQDRSPSTLSIHRAALKRIMDHCGVPTNRLHRFKVTAPLPEYLSQDELRELLSACEPMLVVQCFTAVLYDSGARFNEILSALSKDIEWGAADAGAFLHNVTRKGGRIESINLTSWGTEFLRDWISKRKGNHPKIFGDWTYHQMSREMYRYAKQVGIKGFHPHMLRHSRAVHLKAAGVDWETIGYQLGHVRASETINTYGRLTGRDLKKGIPPTL